MAETASRGRDLPLNILKVQVYVRNTSPMDTRHRFGVNTHLHVAVINRASICHIMKIDLGVVICPSRDTCLDSRAQVDTSYRTDTDRMAKARFGEEGEQMRTKIWIERPTNGAVALRPSQ